MTIIREPKPRPEVKPGQTVIAVVRRGVCTEIVIMGNWEKLERRADPGDLTFRLVDVTGERNWGLPPVEVGTQWPF